MGSKFAGKVGYSIDQHEISPGVIEDAVLERNYKGDVKRVGIKSRIGETILPELDITNEFRIVADAFMYQHFSSIRYIKWMGVCWAVRQVDVQRPRLVLRVGGVYHGATA